MKTKVAKSIPVTEADDVVDLTSDDSFPASDPPSWTAIVGTGPPCRVEDSTDVDAGAAMNDMPATARHILVPTDYSDASQSAFQIACRLSAGGRVTVLHVPEPFQDPFAMAGKRSAWKSQLGLVQCSDPTVRVEHRLEEGAPIEEILRVADSLAPEMIVMGTERRGGLWQALAGSISRAVARRARCPVVRVTVSDASTSVTPSRRILFATDSQTPDLCLLDLANSLAQGGREELFVLSVRSAHRFEPHWYEAVKHRFPARVPGVWPLARIFHMV